MRPDEKSAAPRGQDVNPRETRIPEQVIEARPRVIEDRAVANPLVAHLPDRALDRGPGRERAHDATARHRQLGHPAREVGRVGEVVEEAEGQDHVKLTLEGCGEKVLGEQLNPIFELGEAGPCQLDHRLGKVDADVVSGARFEDELADPARPATDVEHSWVLIGGYDLDRELAAAEQPRPQQPDERPLVLIKVIELLGLVAKPVPDPLGRCG